MIDAIYISGNGLKANEEWLNSISNNVANMQTPSYKRATMTFSEMVTSNPEGRGAERSRSSGVAVSSVTIDSSPGDMKLTGSSLDVAINGDGYFEVIDEYGEFVYTRKGNFHINADGAFVTEHGLKLSAGISVPPGVKTFSISGNGTVSVEFGEDQSELELGQLVLAAFANPDQLVGVGNGLYTPSEESGDAILGTAGEDGLGKFIQGYREMSNVDLVEEMTNLVLAQRAYQLNARLIQTADQIMETVNNMRR